MLQKLSVDEAINKVGAKNRYQIMIFVFFFILFLLTAIVTQGNAYLYQDPIFICKGGKECKQVEACKEAHNDYTKIKINEEKSTHTFTKMFELYCDRKTLKSIAQSLTFIGCSLGTFFFSYFSDHFGRKNTQIASYLTVTLGVILWSFPQDVYMLMAANFIQGFGVYASNTICFLLLREQSGTKFGSVCTGMLIIGTTFCGLYICGLSYAYDNNVSIIIRYYILIPILLFIYPNFIIADSPRYYLKKDHDRVIKEFNVIAKFNKRTPIRIEEFDFSEHENNDDIQKDHNYLALFRFKSLRMLTILACLLKFNMTFVVYGESFALDDLDMNLYIGGMFSGGLNLFSYLFSGVVMSKMNRKTGLLFTGSALSLFNIVQIFFDVPESCEGFTCWQRWASLFSFGISSSFSQIFFTVLSGYLPELYPTAVRGMGLGFIRGVGIAGSALCPYFIQFFESVSIQPLIPMGIVGVLTMFVIFKMKETKDKPLEDFIEEERLHLIPHEGEAEIGNKSKNHSRVEQKNTDGNEFQRNFDRTDGIQNTSTDFQSTVKDSQTEELLSYKN